tara:strand:- start:76577 stop:79531 length:2955 start_codon:yes stop_codon:yes gene_type:complete
MKKLSKAIGIAIGSMAGTMAVAQEADTLEEIIVVGSQIRGASITDSLAVTVLDAEQIEIMGAVSGDELMQMIPEMGQNFFNEAESISGGVNSSRGDVGAFNLRNVGTGNTLVMLNGRRLVNNAGYQTEEVGGSFIPVNTVNSQILPVWGIERVEILRDGASAIYGADAVAGVVNTVLKSDFEGFNVRVRYTDYENVSRNDRLITAEWGQNFNEGRTNVGVFFNYYERDRVPASEDDRWANSDLSRLVPEDSPWFGLSAWRNDSANSLGGQFDVIPSVAASSSLRRNGVVDNAGEFQVFPLGAAQCTYQLNGTACANPDSTPIYRSNLNDFRDVASELERTSFFVNINHEFRNGVESFTELLAYDSSSNLRRHGAYPSVFDFTIAADNYYNPLGPCGSPNRLPDSLVGTSLPCSGLPLLMDNYRFDELPRIVNVDNDTYRVLQGLRWTAGEWNLESAVSWSRATSFDLTNNRVSNILMQEALNDPTPAAYNPFSMGIDSNIERALVDVYRKNETTLTTFDIKSSNSNVFELPAGAVGAVVGLEWRRETFLDDRDPRLDGTIQATDRNGVTFPFISDVVNSSPSSDSSGSRKVGSAFAELQIPVLDTLDLQVAGRYEDFSDVGSTTVGKVAFGWRPTNWGLLRGSWSQGYRVPNLVTVNEGSVARQNTRTDWACVYAADRGGDPNQDILDCTNSTQRVAEGSELLVPEESTNTSLGFVLTPNDQLTVTLDYWTIEKEGTIGLLGEENHTTLDLLRRIEAGLGNCAQEFNPAVQRQAVTDEAAAVYTAAGICPAGLATTVFDKYVNLDTRTVKGYDFGIYYDVDTRFGTFSLSYNGAFLTDYEQKPGGVAEELVAAKASGILPGSIPVSGFANLLNQDGNQDEKHSAQLRWRQGDWGIGLSGYRLGSFYQDSLTLDDGTRYIIPSMTTYDATVDYRTAIFDRNTRIRLGIKNLTDERAPLADRYFGYLSDAHSDYGRYAYLDVRVSF